MHCPFCGHSETKVIDSRLAGEGRQIRRRRECLGVRGTLTTFEAAELVMPTVVKGDRSREAFEKSALLAGMHKALEKRPVGIQAIEAAAAQISHKSCEEWASAKSPRARSANWSWRASASGRGGLRALRARPTGASKTSRPSTPRSTCCAAIAAAPARARTTALLPGDEDRESTNERYRHRRSG